jgi:rod shape determining protein RodA
VKEKLKNHNWVLFFAMIVLIVCGTLAIKSAGNARTQAVFHTMWINNLVTACVGFAIYSFLAYIDYRKFLRNYSIPIFIVSVVLLVAVLIFGTSRLGGKRWLWFFQPSEVFKICLLTALSYLLGSEDSPLWKLKDKVKGLFWYALLVGIPLLLILEEPDLGTTLVLCPAVLVMLFIGNVCRKFLVSVFLVLCFAAAIILGAVYEAEKPSTSKSRRELILKYVPLEDHQIKRVKVFLFPDADIHDAGYNLRQAKISIGSGGLTGKGIGKAESNHLKYLPQVVSMNDFIFCVWAEETGFVGTSFLLFVFSLVLLSGVWIAYRASDLEGQLLAIGITTLIFAHVYINIAMSLGLVPITGLPLPFISSGRTFLIVMMASFGFLQSVSVNRVRNGI